MLRYAQDVDGAHSKRRSLRSAEILAVGAELTVGDTRDTNSGEIARSLTEAGATIARINVLPDRLRVVAGAFRAALRRALSPKGNPRMKVIEAVLKPLGLSLSVVPQQKKARKRVARKPAKAVRVRAAA